MKSNGKRLNGCRVEMIWLLTGFLVFILTAEVCEDLPDIDWLLMDIVERRLKALMLIIKSS